MRARSFAIAVLAPFVACAPTEPSPGDHDAGATNVDADRRADAPTDAPLDLPGDPEEDWAARRAGSGVFYANNFSDYAGDQDLRDRANTFSHEPLVREVVLNTDPAFALSGGKSLELVTYDAAGGNGGAWGDRYKNGESVNKFYFQFAVYFPRQTLAWRSKGTDGQQKVANLERYGAGQVFVGNAKFLGFPSVVTNGTGGVHRYTADVPEYSDEHSYQNAVDAGTPAQPATIREFWHRYGPGRRVTFEHDYGYNASDAALNFLDARGFAWPDPDAAVAGVPYAVDGWTVIEVYIWNRAETGEDSELKVWAARYGEAPTLVIDDDAPAERALGWASYLYQRFELLNYDTPREPEIGYRPTLHTYYSEVLASFEPIPFPGGHALPSQYVRPE